MRALTLPVARYEALALQEYVRTDGPGHLNIGSDACSNVARKGGLIETRAFIATASSRACALQYGRARVSTLRR